MVNKQNLDHIPAVLQPGCDSLKNLQQLSRPVFRGIASFEQVLHLHDHKSFVDVAQDTYQKIQPLLLGVLRLESCNIDQMWFGPSNLGMLYENLEDEHLQDVDKVKIVLVCLTLGEVEKDCMLAFFEQCSRLYSKIFGSRFSSWSSLYDEQRRDRGIDPLIERLHEFRRLLCG